jgi:hypothetical protein
LNADKRSITAFKAADCLRGLALVAVAKIAAQVLARKARYVCRFMDVNPQMGAGIGVAQSTT